MSYLSTSENVGFSSIPQNISDASCASQYKMAVEGVSGNCGSEVNMFIHDSSGDEQTYIPHLSDNFFHSKFKIDPNDLYTFHDSDVIASEITVSHTEENFIFSDNIDIKSKLLESPNKDLDLIGVLTNGDIKEEIVETKKETVNGHYPIKNKIQVKLTDSKNANTKVQNVKIQNNINLDTRNSIVAESRQPINNIKVINNVNSSHNVKVSINSVSSSNVKSVSTAKSAPETFLDVFKREHGVKETPATIIKTEPVAVSTIKVPAAPIKKPAAAKTPTSKAKRGRGPTVHEALQRIPAQNKVIALANTSWHAPGEELFQCGPLDEKKANAFRQVETSSSDDDIPDLDVSCGPVCVEESAAESRSARLALRRAALKRHVARAAALRPVHYSEQRALATLIKKQLKEQSSCLPTQTVNQLLAMRGMQQVLSSQDRRKLRESGWCGGESGRRGSECGECSEEKCSRGALPCARHCFAHVTLAPSQRLYAACAAVFAGGDRCKQPLLPLHDQTPLCTEHAWKRDNYEQLSREWRPQKARRRACPVAPRPPRPPRRPKRRRRPLVRRTHHPHQPHHSQSLTEVNMCSNSSTYDSSEEAGLGALSDTDYMRTSSAHQLEVEQVPPDDILDPSVLSQIPDEAFTEFFNQAEDVSTFGEESELAAALEAVLEERGLAERTLDTISDCFTPHGPAPGTASAPKPSPTPQNTPAPATATALASAPAPADTQNKLKIAASSTINVSPSAS